MLDHALDAGTSGFAYKRLYQLGGIAALIAAALTLGEVILFAVYPQPGAITDWFLLFQNNKFIGLLDFWGLEIPMYLMFILVFLGFYLVLREANRGLMALALILAILGIGIFLATNNPISMLSLSNQYAAVKTDLERSTLQAAGQAMLVNTNQRAIGGFNMGLFLVSVAGLIASLVMLQANSFSRFTAQAGILANALSLADYLREALTSSAIIALLVILPYVLLLTLWLVLAGRRLYQLGSIKKMLPEQS